MIHKQILQNVRLMCFLFVLPSIKISVHCKCMFHLFFYTEPVSLAFSPLRKMPYMGTFEISIPKNKAHEPIFYFAFVLASIYTECKNPERERPYLF